MTVVYVDKPLSKAHVGDAAFDLVYCGDEDVTLGVLERFAAETTIGKIAIPVGVCGDVCPRSGLALNHGITVLNGPGIVDSGYRGKVKAVLINLSNEPYTISKGDRVAQIRFVRLEPVEIVVADPEDDVFLPADERGDGGFGSSGKN